MANILFVSEQSDFEFPLAEAARKQVYKEALLASKANNVEVLIISSYKKYFFSDEGIKIKIIPRRSLAFYVFYVNKFESVKFIGNVGLSALLTGIFTWRNKEITLCDGGICSLVSSQRKLTFFIKALPYLYSKVLVYTEHQKYILDQFSRKYSKITNLKMPKLDNEIKLSNRDKYESTTLLYMSHMSEFKGINALFYVFEELKKDIPDLQLVLAINGVRSEPKMEEKLSLLKNKYKEDIIVKGKIDPYHELAKVHLYIYLFKKENGTFAFPLSLYESMQCGTAFLGPAISGVEEFFDDYFLANPENFDECLEKARYLLRDKVSVKSKISDNLNGINERL